MSVLGSVMSSRLLATRVAALLAPPVSNGRGLYPRRGIPPRAAHPRRRGSGARTLSAGRGWVRDHQRPPERIRPVGPALLEDGCAGHGVREGGGLSVEVVGVVKDESLQGAGAPGRAPLELPVMREQRVGEAQRQ